MLMASAQPADAGSSSRATTPHRHGRRRAASRALGRPTAIRCRAASIGDIINLFGYAEAQPKTPAINGAIAAADAMATRARRSTTGSTSVDDDARKIKLELGIFTDPATARRRSPMQFAMLGAVDEDAVDHRRPSGHTIDTDPS